MDVNDDEQILQHQSSSFLHLVYYIYLNQILVSQRHLYRANKPLTMKYEPL